MKQAKDTLLYKIKRLYTELFLVSLHNRLSRYHHQQQSFHLDINDTLNRLIDKITSESWHTHSAKEVSDTQAGGTTNANPPQSERPLKIKTHSTNVLTMTWNGLSMFLHKQKAHEHDPRMAGKLQQCVWDHVHSAHRYARTGDGNTAKLHANIASNAIKTLSHYMPEMEYNAFYDEISGELKSITTESENIY